MSCHVFQCATCQGVYDGAAYRNYPEPRRNVFGDVPGDSPLYCSEQCRGGFESLPFRYV